MQRQQALRTSRPLAGSRLEPVDATPSPMASRQMTAGPFHPAPPRFYIESVTPGGDLIREHPDGSSELIRFDEDGRPYVERSV